MVEKKNLSMSVRLFGSSEQVRGGDSHIIWGERHSDTLGLSNGERVSQVVGL